MYYWEDHVGIKGVTAFSQLSLQVDLALNIKSGNLRLAKRINFGVFQSVAADRIAAKRHYYLTSCTWRADRYTKTLFKLLDSSKKIEICRCIWDPVTHYSVRIGRRNLKKDHNWMNRSFSPAANEVGFEKTGYIRWTLYNKTSLELHWKYSKAWTFRLTMRDKKLLNVAKLQHVLTSSADMLKRSEPRHIRERGWQVTILYGGW